MSKVYKAYLTDNVGPKGATFWIMEATLEQVGDRTFVNHGGSLREEVHKWHDSRAAAMQEAARIIADRATLLAEQAMTLLREAAQERAAAEVVTV